MLSWIKYWFSKPEPTPTPITTIEVHPRNLYPHPKGEVLLNPYTRYTMTPPRILEWWAKEPKYDHNPDEKKDEV